MIADPRRLQRLLHVLLRVFASGWLAHPALSPARLRPSAACLPAWCLRLSELSALLPGASQDARGSGGSRPFTLGEAAELLASGYRYLRTNLPPATASAAAIQPLPILRRLEEAPPGAPGRTVMARLQAYLRRHCAEDLRAAFVHGSYSTGDVTAYSDLDTLVILRTAVVEDSQRLLACAARLAESNRYLYECDLLQHHTHFVLTETDLQWYADAFFPRVLFGFSTLLLGEGPLAAVHTRDSAAECREDLESMCRHFLEPPATARLRRGFYLKLHLSRFLILPTLLSQVLGEFCYKRDAFARVRHHYAPEIWSVMDEVSAIRREWHQTSPGLWARIAGLHPLLPAVLFRRLGRWGIPAEYFRRAADPAFRERQRLFARRTLDIAAAAAPGPGSRS